jgi:hypothetical protein
MDVIRTVNDDQEQIILDILKLHVPSGKIDVDPTYSKGVFYKGLVAAPEFKFDLYPQTEDTIQASADMLPLADNFVDCIMFDPPFVISSGPSLKENKIGQNLTHTRFGSFPTVQSLWKFYHESLEEFYRISKPGGIVIFKCQDTVSSGKNYMSHCEVYRMAGELGFYAKDLFILTAKSRINSFGGKWHTQRHARKYHSYFWVLEKR